MNRFHLVLPILLCACGFSDVIDEGVEAGDAGTTIVTPVDAGTAPDPTEPEPKFNGELVGAEPAADDNVIGTDDPNAPQLRAAQILYATTPRWKLSFSDDFNGPRDADEDRACFSGRPLKCAYGTNSWVEDCKPAQIHPGLKNLNRCNWTILENYNYWSAKQSTFSSSMVKVDGGRLVLNAAKANPPSGGLDCGTPIPGQEWLFTSKCPYKVGGLISTHYVNKWDAPGRVDQPGFTQARGRFEVRGRLSSGPGSWPAYWMLPNEGTWPADGEIDLVEYLNTSPFDAVLTLHDKDGGFHSGWGTWFRTKPAFNRTMIEDFHTWSVEWEPGEMRAYLDNRLIRTTGTHTLIDDVWDNDTCHIGLPEKPFYFILNDGIAKWEGADAKGNADWDTFWHFEGEIDFARAYTKCESDADYCPGGGEFDGKDTCTPLPSGGRPRPPYKSPCVENTLSPSCPNPCAGVGSFDGYNCYLRSAPSNMKLYEKNGRFRYKYKLGVTLRKQCRTGDAFIGTFDGCDAGPIPAGRSTFEYGSGFYATATCSTTKNPPRCENPCPYGGSFDGANCFVAASPAGTEPFLFERKFYYKKLAGANPCPSAPAGFTVAYDGANCRVEIPVAQGAVPFVYDRKFYFSACGNMPDFQAIPAGSVATTKDEPSCSP